MQNSPYPEKRCQNSNIETGCASSPRRTCTSRSRSWAPGPRADRLDRGFLARSSRRCRRARAHTRPLPRDALGRDAGLEDEEGRATRIAEDAHRRLAELGVYEPEKRPWLPHVTVIRFRERPRLSPSVPGLGPVTMSDAAVYMSRLHPTGAQYEVVESVPLGGG